MDREKVIKGLEHCIPDPNKSLHERTEENECRHAECPYGGKEYQYGMGCFWSLMSDALALLKEPELIRCKNCVNRHDPINCKMYSEGMDTSDDWFCADGKR